MASNGEIQSVIIHALIIKPVKVTPSFRNGALSALNPTVISSYFPWLTLSYPIVMVTLR